MIDNLERVLPRSARIIGDDLTVGGITLTELADRWSTPLVVYDEQHIVDAATRWVQAFSSYTPGVLVAYASKAFANVAVMNLLSDLGLGADVSSEGELAVALTAGVSGDRIVMHGNDKSDVELRQAVLNQIGLVVVDAEDELTRLETIAKELGCVQDILVRVNPDIDVETHRYIRTAHAGSKFGVDGDQACALLGRAQHSSHLNPRGVHVHLGSQLLQLDPWSQVLEWLASWAVTLYERHALHLDIVDVGGGLGIAYLPTQTPPEIEDVAATIIERITHHWTAHDMPLPQLIVEPGRSIIGQAAITVYRVGVVKESAGHRYVNVDGGVSDNPRPMLYQAEYTALLPARMTEPVDGSWWVAGRHCESGDILVEDAKLPRPARGDLLCVAATGAYALSMASNYNMVARPAAVLITEQGDQKLILRRETLDDVLAMQPALRGTRTASPAVSIEEAVQIATNQVILARPDLPRSVVLAAAGAAALGVGANDRITAEAVASRTLTMFSGPAQ